MSSPIPIPPDMAPGPIVIGVDDAESCGRIVRAGVFLAAAGGRSVLLVHVRRRVMPVMEGYVPVPEEAELGEQAEDEIQQELVRVLTNSGDLDPVNWELVTSYGDPGAELTRIADEKDASCVVVGKRYRGFGDLLHRITTGSVSRTVVNAHRFPVLIIP